MPGVPTASGRKREGRILLPTSDCIDSTSANQMHQKLVVGHWVRRRKCMLARLSPRMRFWVVLHVGLAALGDYDGEGFED
jgi:hypothetical protein